MTQCRTREVADSRFQCAARLAIEFAIPVHLLDLLQHLEKVDLEGGHLVVESVVRDWLQSGRLDEGQRQRLRAGLTALSDIYAAHIRLEEQQVFALASRLLDAGQVRAIGAEMQERRARG